MALQPLHGGPNHKALTQVGPRKAKRCAQNTNTKENHRPAEHFDYQAINLTGTVSSATEDSSCKRQ